MERRYDTPDESVAAMEAREARQERFADLAFDLPPVKDGLNWKQCSICMDDFVAWRDTPDMTECVVCRDRSWQVCDGQSFPRCYVEHECLCKGLTHCTRCGDAVLSEWTVRGRCRECRP